MYPDVPLIASILFVLAGLWLLERSSDWFVDGAADLARRFHVSPFIIGMVIIGFGTCAPEFCVSVMTGVGGHADLSLGNAYGSCVFNIAGVLGVTAIIAPIAVKKGIVYVAGPALAAMSALSLWLLYDGRLVRGEALVLILVFAVFFPLYCWWDNRGEPPLKEEALMSGNPLSKSLALLVLGLVVLIGSSHLLVWGAVDLARAMGVSELLIGLTVIAIGTSVPELATAIQSARKGHNELVLGNIVGSNIFNTLVIVGTADAITPTASYSPYLVSRDLPVMIALSLMISIFGLNGRITRFEGILWVLVFLAYMALTIYQEAYL